AYLFPNKLGPTNQVTQTKRHKHPTLQSCSKLQQVLTNNEVRQFIKRRMNKTQGVNTRFTQHPFYFRHDLKSFRTMVTTNSCSAITAKRQIIEHSSVNHIRH